MKRNSIKLISLITLICQTLEIPEFHFIVFQFLLLQFQQPLHSFQGPSEVQEMLPPHFERPPTVQHVHHLVHSLAEAALQVRDRAGLGRPGLRDRVFRPQRHLVAGRDEVEHRGDQSLDRHLGEQGRVALDQLGQLGGVGLEELLVDFKFITLTELLAGHVGANRRFLRSLGGFVRVNEHHSEALVDVIVRQVEAEVFPEKVLVLGNNKGPAKLVIVAQTGPDILLLCLGFQQFFLIVLLDTGQCNGVLYVQLLLLVIKESIKFGEGLDFGVRRAQRQKTRKDARVDLDCVDVGFVDADLGPVFEGFLGEGRRLLC